MTVGDVKRFLKDLAAYGIVSDDTQVITFGCECGCQKRTNGTVVLLGPNGYMGRWIAVEERPSPALKDGPYFVESPSPIAVYDTPQDSLACSPCKARVGTGYVNGSPVAHPDCTNPNGCRCIVRVQAAIKEAGIGA